MKRSTAIGLQRTAAGEKAVRAADSHRNAEAGIAVSAWRRPSGRHRGFTLIELVVVVSIAAILAGVAFPALMNMVRTSAVTSATNQLVTSLNWARNQAIVMHSTVRVCKTSSPNSATPTCDTSAGSNGYEKGWLVFIDANANGVYDTGETLLKRISPDNNNKITANGSPSTTIGVALNVGFTPLGMQAAASSATSSVSGTSMSNSFIVVCDDRGWSGSGQYAKVISISSAGRIAAAKGNNQSAISTSASTCTP